MPAIVPAYSNNIPQPTDEPSQSQPRILDNFDGINQIWDINHYAFNEANAGKHRFCNMVLQGAAPASANNEFQFYTLNDTVSTHDELYIRRSQNNTQLPNATVPFTAQGASYTWLPSGYLVKWGSFVVLAAGAVLDVRAHIFPVAANIPVFRSAPVYVNVAASTTGIPNGTNPNAVAYFNTATDLQLTYRIMKRNEIATPITQNNTVYWVAIGLGIV